MVKIFLRKDAPSIYIRLIILVHLLFSYNAFSGWWYSLLGAILIVLLARKCWSIEYLEWIGLRVTPKEVGITFFMLVLVVLGSFKLIALIASSAGVILKIQPFTVFIHLIGYTFNEEVVVGAILLNYLVKRFVKTRRLLISTIVATIFCVLHYIFYRWIFFDKGVLSLFTLVSLFAVGLIRNNLILATGHIGYSWALHAGWVFIMFGFVHTESLTGKVLGEPERFNLYLGYSATILILASAAITSLWLLVGKKSLNENRT